MTTLFQYNNAWQHYMVHSDLLLRGKEEVLADHHGTPRLRLRGSLWAPDQVISIAPLGNLAPTIVQWERMAVRDALVVMRGNSIEAVVQRRREMRNGTMFVVITGQVPPIVMQGYPPMYQLKRNTCLIATFAVVQLGVHALVASTEDITLLLAIGIALHALDTCQAGLA